MAFRPSSQTGSADLLLVFPPITEARQFPYLSLPQMTGYLRARGHRVVQHDLNMEICHNLFTGTQLRAAAQPGSGTELKQAFDSHTGHYLAESAPLLAEAAFDKVPTPGLPGDSAIRLVLRGIDLTLRHSAWYRIPRDFAELDDMVVRQPTEPVTEVTHRLLAEALLRHRPAVVGISVPFFSQLAPALSIAAWVKQLRPSTVLVLGGQQVMLRAADLGRLRSTQQFVDALCTSAGEEPLDRLLQNLDNPQRPIPGLIWRPFTTPPTTMPALRFAELPPPDFTGLPVARYLVPQVQLPIATCVGCYWGRCVFCSYGNRSLGPGGYQQATDRQIADWIEACVRRWGVTDLVVADENSNLRLVARGLQVARQRGLRVTVRLRNRLEPSLLDVEFCRTLADLGCVSMSCGYETSSQRLLDKMDKGIDVSTYPQIIDNLDAVGIDLRLSVMGGLFDETPQEAARSKQFLLSNGAKLGIDVLQMLVVEPGSRLADDAATFNLDLTGQTLQGNPEFSYLGGRVGEGFTYRDGLGRDARSVELSAVYREVKPAKNAALPPHLQPPAPSRPRSTDGVFALHPWVRLMQAPGHGTILADVQWVRVYRLSDDHTYDPVAHAIRTGANTALFDNLQAAGLGPERG